MMVKTLSFWLTSTALLVALHSPPLAVNAAQPLKRATGQDAAYKEVELFEAMDSGDLDVQFIPKDSRSGNVLLKNNTDKPLSVRLPAAFAGVPVLAQRGGGGGGGLGGGGGGGGGGLGGGGLGGGGGGGGGQGVGGGLGGGLGGGGLGGGGLGGGGGFGGGGFFNVAPEKVGKISVNLVCLEHGKNEPTPRMKYKIVPIETFTQDPRVIALCSMLGRNEVPQNAAQAAAWHLTDGLNWDQLARKNRVQTRFQTVKYFNAAELFLAKRLVAEVDRRAGGHRPGNGVSLAD